LETDRITWEVSFYLKGGDWELVFLLTGLFGLSSSLKVFEETLGEGDLGELLLDDLLFTGLGVLALYASPLVGEAVTFL
jgi:hypothetical protein